MVAYQEKCDASSAAVTKSAKINWVEGERRRKQAKTSLALAAPFDSLLSHMHARDAIIRARFFFQPR
jgi:hypothetical protein